MRFDLTRPCSNCPFRRDKPPFMLNAKRVRGILGGGIGKDYWPAASFPCHKTIEYTDNDKAIVGPNAQQCAGVMLILWRECRPNDAMQIGERLGLWSPALLDTSSPVYLSTEEAMRVIPGPRETRKDVSK